MTRIAQVTAYWGPAYPTGSGVFCYEISKRLAKQFEVHVFTSSIGRFNNLNSIDNLHVHPLYTYGVLWDMNPIANVFTQLLKNDFDIIHVHSYIFFQLIPRLNICGKYTMKKLVWVGKRAVDNPSDG